MNIKEIFSMDARTTATILRFIAMLQLALSALLVVIGFFVWVGADEYSHKGPIGVSIMLAGIGFALSAFVFNGFAVIVKAAYLYIEKNEPEEE